MNIMSLPELQPIKGFLVYWFYVLLFKTTMTVSFPSELLECFNGLYSLPSTNNSHNLMTVTLHG